MPPSLIWRQRQLPNSACEAIAWPSGSMTCAMTRWSPWPRPCMASVMAKARIWSSLSMRATSAAEAVSRQPAKTCVGARQSAIASRTLIARPPIGLLLAILLRRPPLQIRGRRHADHIEAGIDKVHFAGDATCQVAKQIKCRPADMVKLDGFLERGMALVPFEHHAGIAHRRARKGAHRPGRDGVHPDAVLAQIGGEIA